MPKMNARTGLIFFLMLASFLFGMGFQSVRAGEDLESKLEVFLQVLDIIRNDYVDKKLDNTQLVYGSIKGLLTGLGDPYTRFMEPKAFKEMKIRLSGSYFGIGIYIGMKDEQLVVISPIASTPADKAGLLAGDKIIKIDGKTTLHMALEEAVSLIRGPKGTPVTLGILRGKWKEPKDFVIERDKIVIKSVETPALKRSDILYLKLNTFENQSAADEVAAVLQKGQKSNVNKGLVLDMRNNGGGLLHNAVEIGSMFIAEGPIVYTVDRDKRRESLDANGRLIWNKPVVVLINGASASASEILAGALKDTGKAKLVGTKTFGKASVQSVRNLSDGSALLVTVAKYLTPNGDDISKKGIQPDVVVNLPSAEANGDDKEMIPPPKDLEKDIQLQEAIKVLDKMIISAEAF